MAKAKIPRKSTWVDMTAMTDVAFLLLTFFMLATKFKPDEPVDVTTPSSVAEIKLPETGVVQITVDPEDRVFFGIEGQPIRADLLQRIGAKKGITFTEEEIKVFSITTTFGVPINELKGYLSLDFDAQKKFVQKGIPTDSLNNELADWIVEARRAAQSQGTVAVIAIRGDQNAGYPIIKRVIATLQDQNVNRFNLITNQESEDNK